MRPLFVSFAVGLGVGVLYGLLHVKSPAPPVVALLLLVRHDRLAVIGCLLLVGFVAATTGGAHRFWSATGDEQVPQLINFLKNLAIIGGLLSLASIYGSRLPNKVAA